MTRLPMVSVVVPSFRMAHFLPQMLASTLGQDHRPLEIIVADGGSDDGTVALLREQAASHPELHWLSEPDEGPADAVNKGLSMARGEFVVIQNADDVFRPSALAAAIATLQAHPQSSFVYGDIEIIDEAGNVRSTRRFPDFSWEAFFGLSCTVAQSSILFRRELALAIGGWNGNYYGCDLDFWMRLAFRGEPVHIPQVLSAWRRYEGQRTNEAQYARIWEDYQRMVVESEDIRNTSPRIRRLAHASTHLLALRYFPQDRRWAVRGHMLRGLAGHPSAWRYLPWQLFARKLPGGSALQTLRQRWRSVDSGGQA